MKKTRCWYDLRYSCLHPDIHLLKRDCKTCGVGKIKGVTYPSEPLTLEIIDRMMASLKVEK